MVVVSAGVLLSFTLDWDNTLANAFRAIGFLLLGLTSTLGKTYRWTCFGTAFVGAISVAFELLPISSPFSGTTTDRIGVIAGMAILIAIPILFIRDHVSPTSEDFRAIERAYKERKRQEREQREGIN
jgi:hypothetical protein